MTIHINTGYATLSLINMQTIDIFKQLQNSKYIKKT